jgi:hypothetical protein
VWHDQRNMQHKVKYPRPPWAMAKDEIPLVEAILLSLKTPSSWPPVRKFFTEIGHLKTSEILLFAGDTGAYFLRHIEIGSTFRDLFVRLLRVTERLAHTHTHTCTRTHTIDARPHVVRARIFKYGAYDVSGTYDVLPFRCMFKASTPGDRKFILKELPELMTKLELGLPQTWNTTVVHIYTFHSVLIMMLAGPFCVSNMFKVCTYMHAHTTYALCMQLTGAYGVRSSSCVCRLSSSTQSSRA